MLKKISKLLLAIILFLSNTNIIYALNIYENNTYSIYYNGIKNNTNYSVAAIDGGDRVFYDLEGITTILKAKGGTDIKIYRLGQSLETDSIKSSITYISNDLGNNIENNNNIELITDYSKIKENDNIAIITKLNDKLIYGITNQIGTNKFIPFALIKYDVYIDAENSQTTYETVLFNSVNIGADVESYLSNNTVYYPIRFISELLGGVIDLNYANTESEKTKILINFDKKELYKTEYVHSLDSDKDNGIISKNQCIDMKILKDGNSINKYIYNVDNPNLKIVQKKDLDKIIDDTEKLEIYKSKSSDISICNTSEAINLSNIKLGIFVGSENEMFIPTNLTISNNTIMINDSEDITVVTNKEQAIKNIEFKNSNSEKLEMDTTFNNTTTEYTTKNELNASEESVCYDITYDDDQVETGCAYMNPNNTSNKVIIDKYSFNILRKLKDSNTNIYELKYKKTNDSDWNVLYKNDEGKYVIKGKYSDYEIMITPEKETSSVNSNNGTVTKENNYYKLIPASNVQIFNIKAEDGKQTEYSITFDESEIKEKLESLEVYQGTTKLTTTGPDENNKYETKEWDSSIEGPLKLKYKISSGEEFEVDFYPNDENKKTGYIYVNNNTYTVVVKEKEKVPNKEETNKNNNSSSTNTSTTTEKKQIDPIKCSATETIKKGKTTAGLNIRIAPKDGDVISVLNNNQELEIVKEQDGWYEVKYPNDTSKCGWVSDDYVSIINNEAITIDNSEIARISREIRNFCINDKNYVKYWKKANNENKTKTINEFLKVLKISNNIVYYSPDISSNYFQIYNYDNNYEKMYRHLTMILVLERAKNSGDITYDVRNGKGDISAFFAYLNKSKDPKEVTGKRITTTKILDDIEYCVNGLVDKTKVGKKIKKDYIYHTNEEKLYKKITFKFKKG